MMAPANVLGSARVGVQNQRELPASTHTIGWSFRGKPIEVQHWGSFRAPLRVLLLCGQHGDERGIRRALAGWVQHRLTNLLADMPALQVAILADANPDGAELRTRTNAQGIDLNRDHLLLEAPETRAIHQFVARWRPHVILDMHNYPSRRLPLVKEQLRYGWDVCVDYPSNPATGMGMGNPLVDSLMCELDRELTAKGYCFGRYSVVNPNGTVRHSTPHLVDARNVLTLRHGALTLLLEARNPGKRESREQRGFVREAVMDACAQLLRWCAAHQESLLRFREDMESNDRIPLRFRRPAADTGVAVPVADLNTGKPRTLEFSRYRPHVEGRRTVSAPYGYAVSLGEHGLLRILGRHGFQAYLAVPGERCIVEETRPVDEGTGTLLTVSPSKKLWRIRYERSLEGFAIFPFQQPGGRCLALLLEPESAYALHHGSAADSSVISAPLCPVRRVQQLCSPIGCDFQIEVAS